MEAVLKRFESLITLLAYNLSNEISTLKSVQLKYPLSVHQELQPWDDTLSSIDSVCLEETSTNGWDSAEMLRVNKDRFNVISSYDPNLPQYT